MKLPDWAWTGLAGVVIGAALFFFVCQSQKRAEQAADKATIAAQAVTIGDLQKRTARVDTVHQRDTVRLRGATVVRDSVVQVTRIDTFRVNVPVEVVREVLKADSAVIGACTAALHSCEEQQGILRQIITADSSALRATSRELARANIRNRLGCYAGGQATGTGTNPIQVRLGVGVGCGIRIF